jgi:hypothetical protein
MDAEIAAHLKICHHCQMIMKANPHVPDLVSSVPQRTEPNQFTLCITDAFIKFINKVALPNNEAATMSMAIFDHFGRQPRKRIQCWII